MSSGSNHQPAGRQPFVDALGDPSVVDLARRLGLPASYLGDVGRHVVPLVRAIDRAVGAKRGPLIVGLNGCQGSGKSTLAQFVSKLLRKGAGRRTVILSIDDFYLSRADRMQMAREIHPLFATRGVPGTHDVGLAQKTLTDLLQHAGSAPVRIPVFDKAADDRCPPELWRSVDPSPDLILFEGWCVGCRPQPAEALVAPVNRLERDEDSDGSWRRAVNASLDGPYRELFDRLDELVMLKAPSFDIVFAWRSRQEQMLAQHAGTARVMNPEKLRRFIDHYQRLTEHQLSTLASAADAVIELDSDHRLVAHRGAIFATP